MDELQVKLKPTPAAAKSYIFCVLTMPLTPKPNETESLDPARVTP